MAALSFSRSLLFPASRCVYPVLLNRSLHITSRDLQQKDPIQDKTISLLFNIIWRRSNFFLSNIFKPSVPLIDSNRTVVRYTQDEAKKSI